MSKISLNIDTINQNLQFTLYIINLTTIKSIVMYFTLYNPFVHNMTFNFDWRNFILFFQNSLFQVKYFIYAECESVSRLPSQNIHNS